MIRREFRIVAATLAVLVSLVGIFVALDGLVFDSQTVFRYGAAALLVGIACFVLLLNPGPRDHD
jgi:hypothetical protein